MSSDDTTAVLAKLDEKLSDVLARLDALKVPEQPGLSVVAFAKKAGVSKNTIFRKINSGDVIKKNGRVPYSELRKFLS